MTPIHDFHAHIYYDPDAVEAAKALAAEVQKRFGVRVGHFHLAPVGPHPRGSCQMTVPTERFGEVATWLSVNRVRSDHLRPCLDRRRSLRPQPKRDMVRPERAARSVDLRLKSVAAFARQPGERYRYPFGADEQESQTEYLRVLMRSLRQKLEADPSRPAMLINEPGVGYRLLGG